MNLFGWRHRRNEDDGEERGLSDEMRQELQDPEVRRAAIAGALSAALLVGLVCVVIFGLAIALMIQLWT